MSDTTDKLIEVAPAPVTAKKGAPSFETVSAPLAGGSYVVKNGVPELVHATQVDNVKREAEHAAVIEANAKGGN